MVWSIPLYSTHPDCLAGIWELQTCHAPLICKCFCAYFALGDVGTEIDEHLMPILFLNSIKYPMKKEMGRSQVLRQRLLDTLFVGLNPSVPDHIYCILIPPFCSTTFFFKFWIDFFLFFVPTSFIAISRETPQANVPLTPGPLINFREKYEKGLVTLMHITVYPIFSKVQKKPGRQELGNSCLFLTRVPYFNRVNYIFCPWFAGISLSVWFF